MDTELVAPERQPQRILIALGVLWLLLAGLIVISQFGRPSPIEVEWVTETEVDTAGFNVYRSRSADGPFSQINRQLIPSRGSAVSGASYSFIDQDVVPGETYYYELEDVELDNSTERHPVITYSVPLVEWWVPLIAAFSAVVGLVLLLRGLRPERIL